MRDHSSATARGVSPGWTTFGSTLRLFTSTRIFPWIRLRQRAPGFKGRFVPTGCDRRRVDRGRQLRGAAVALCEVTPNRCPRRASEVWAPSVRLLPLRKTSADDLPPWSWPIPVRGHLSKAIGLLMGPMDTARLRPQILARQPRLPFRRARAALAGILSWHHRRPRTRDPTACTRPGLERPADD